jgi:exopolysaccharide biosynthesis WecB/TagA/CpsF family protein
MKKFEIFGVNYTATDYEEATKEIIKNGSRHESFGVSALAVHGLITAHSNPEIRAQVNKINLVVPDGQPVKWALNILHDAKLSDRVYGPTLTLKVLEKANELGLKIFLFGSTQSTCEKFASFIRLNYPLVEIAGIHIDRFREATIDEDALDIKKINDSKAHIVLVGRGCPRQEIWVGNHLGKVHAAMMAVGAAFDFHAGTVKQAPGWMQNAGLEWLFRLIQEPKRLWKRYLFTNSIFIYLFFKHKFFFSKANNL